MSEPLGLIEDGEVLLTADYPDEDELPTNRLKSGNLAQQQSVVEEIDWLLKLRTRNLTTQQLNESALRSDMRPAGMAAHTTPVRIVPTLGARFTTGLRRGTLMIVLAALAVGALAGAAYLLASTSWLSNYATPALTGSEPASEPQSQAVAPLPDAGTLRDSHDTPRGYDYPQAGSGEEAVPGESSALSGLDARNLRDKGIAAYKSGDYAGAAKYLEDSVNITSDDPVAQYQLGLAYMAVQGRDHALDDAELAFRTAISLQPGWSAPYQMTAETLMRRGYYEQAVPPALQATQLEPTRGDAWMTLGRTYSGAGKEAEATRAFAEAAKYAPAPAQP
jgi:tetratricopeptide (TPR) repeat protein